MGLLEGAEIHPRLRLERVIARGSFGVVFRARQIAVARDVAVKVLHAGLAPNSEPGRLFRDEIRAIGTLNHRNVVRIFDADETTDGRLYFVMELLDGPTLQQLAEDGALSPTRAVDLVAQLLDGLAAVHSAGHIHADVKPANVVVCKEHGADRVVLIDFGLSRLRQEDRPTEAVGGTRAYMAPEHLRAWQVSTRSDVYSVALVLVKLLTGWHRTNNELVPPLDGIADPALAVALRRALATDPEARPSAADFARALRGGQPDEPPAPGPPPPFREFAPLTERDRNRLCGRAADVLRVTRRIETARAVVLTAPSGTGKTSLLRAGVIPYLDAIGQPYVYIACEPGVASSLAARVSPDGSALGEAVRRRVESGHRLVVILDQLEVSLADNEAPALLDTLLDSGAAMVLGVREDFVARLLAASPTLAEGVPQVRLSPLDRSGAREALVTPLAEHDVTLAEDLLVRLLDDMQRVGRETGRGGGDSSEVIYPPHLQLVGAALFDALGPGERELRLEHYRRLGGFTAIVGDHLERTLGELPANDQQIAREIFLDLVTSTHTRVPRTEPDLVDAIGGRHGEIATRSVLAQLEARRLIARTSSLDGVASWSLVHDTLAPRIEAWLTVHDLDRRRSAELVRFHLRQSQPDAPALLSARQLTSITRFVDLIDELEREWQRRRDAVWTPRSLVERSRRALRYRRVLLGSVTAAVVALTTVLVVSWFVERARRQHSEQLRALNIGRIDLVLRMFDWQRDARGALTTVPVTGDMPGLGWQLLEVDEDDPDAPGLPVAAGRFARGTLRRISSALVETGVEVRAGDAFLAISGRGTGGEICSPSLLPLRRLRGNAEYERPRRIELRVPTCQASRFDMQRVPEGLFISGGLGMPPPAGLPLDQVEPEQELRLPEFAIDRTEITNAAFAVFAEMSNVHEIQAESYTDAFAIAAEPDYPRTNLDWFDARAYCRFLGKDLPTRQQWQKALRGGLVSPSGEPNPRPRRNVPWLDPPANARAYAAIVTADIANANLQLGMASDPRHPSPVGSHPHDTSPYGVVDLAGNVQEWTLDPESGTAAIVERRRPRITRGGNWFDTTFDTLDVYMAVNNVRSPHTRFQFVGARCATRLTAAAAPVPWAGR